MKAILVSFLLLIGGCCSYKVMLYPPFREVGLVPRKEDSSQACARVFKELKKLKVAVKEARFLDDQEHASLIDWKKGALGTVILSLPSKKFHSWLSGKGAIYVKAEYNEGLYEERVCIQDLLRRAEKRGMEILVRTVSDSSGIILLNFWKPVKEGV